MTTGEITDKVLTRLGESLTRPGFFAPIEVETAINRAQRLMCLLALPLERVVTVALGAGDFDFHLFDEQGDFLAPLRVQVTGGARLEPRRIEDLTAANPAWPGAVGEPERYAQLGFDYFVVDPHPAGAGTTLDITIAHAPMKLMGPTSAPEIPEEFHQALEDGAVFFARLKEGGLELQNALPYFERFLQAAMTLAGRTRARAAGQRYDRMPPEINLADRSKWPGFRGVFPSGQLIGQQSGGLG